MQYLSRKSALCAAVLFATVASLAGECHYRNINNPQLGRDCSTTLFNNAGYDIRANLDYKFGETKFHHRLIPVRKSDRDLYTDQAYDIDFTVWVVGAKNSNYFRISIGDDVIAKDTADHRGVDFFNVSEDDGTSKEPSTTIYPELDGTKKWTIEYYTDAKCDSKPLFPDSRGFPTGCERLPNAKALHFKQQEPLPNSEEGRRFYLTVFADDKCKDVKRVLQDGCLDTSGSHFFTVNVGIL